MLRRRRLLRAPCSSARFACARSWPWLRRPAPPPEPSSASIGCSMRLRFPAPRFRTSRSPPTAPGSPTSRVGRTTRIGWIFGPTTSSRARAACSSTRACSRRRKSICPMRSARGASGSARPHFRESSSTASLLRGVRCSFRSMDGSTTTISRDPRARRSSRSRPKAASSPMPPSHRAAPIWPTSGTRTSTPTTLRAARRRRSRTMAAAPSRTGWRSSSRRRRWIAARATGGRPTNATSPSRASMRPRCRSPGGSRSPRTTCAPSSRATRPPAARTSPCAWAWPIGSAGPSPGSISARSRTSISPGSPGFRMARPSPSSARAAISIVSTCSLPTSRRAPRARCSASTATPGSSSAMSSRSCADRTSSSGPRCATATEKSPTERHLYRASLETPDPHEVLRISREDGLHAVALAPQARFYVDQFNSREQPLQVSLRDLDGRLIEFLLENRLDRTHPDAPYLADNAMPTFGTLTASDGQTLHYRLFLPPHLEPKRRYPALVEVYGGPGVQRVLNGWSGGTFTQILTRAGYIVFQLDNRGSAGRGTRFQAPIHGRLGEVELADQVLGARWLATQSYVDPDRIGVHGWSYGGYMTLMLLLKAPDLFKAGVAGAPVTDWTLYDTHYTERYLGTPQANAAGYAASSVLPYADRLNGALLVMHGMADDNVLFLHSTKLFRRLQDLGKPFETMVYPGGKHGLMREHDGRHGYATMLRFFDAHLKRSPD